MQKKVLYDFRKLILLPKKEFEDTMPFPCGESSDELGYLLLYAPQGAISVADASSIAEHQV